MAQPKRPARTPDKSATKDSLKALLEGMGFVPEVPFKGLSGTRRWRWDWFLESARLAVEYHGLGVGHQSIRGTWRDHEKVTEGQLAGLTVIQCNLDSVSDGRCEKWVRMVVDRGATR